MKNPRKSKAVRSKSRATDVVVPAIVEDEFGHYRIRAGRLSGNFVARAFPNSSSSGQGLIAEAQGSSQDDAIAALKALLGEREVQRVAARRWEPRSNISVPSQEEFAEALQQTDLSKVQQSMLKAQAIAGVAGLTKAALMNAAGYRSQDTAVKAFAKAGALVAKFLGVELQSEDEPDGFGPIRVLAVRQEGERDAPAIWIMHEELRRAVWATL